MQLVGDIVQWYLTAVAKPQRMQPGLLLQHSKISHFYAMRLETFLHETNEAQNVELILRRAPQHLVSPRPSLVV